MRTPLQSPLAVSGQPTNESAPGFRAAPGGGNTRSGTLLLVEAYAAIWLLLFGLIAWTLRRQSRMNARILRLEQELGRDRAGAVPPADDGDAPAGR